MRAFITVGLGGAGQSLNTCLIANLFDFSHGCMDMNVFYTEDELRTQADTFTGKVNIGESHIRHLEHENYRCPGFFSVEYRPGGPQHRQAAPRRPVQEGDGAGRGSR